MIYERVDAGTAIRQGDIFHGLPRVDISLADLAVVSRDPSTNSLEHRVMSWSDALSDPNTAESRESEDETTQLVRAVLPVSVVSAIVITQDCDAERADDLSLCEIDLLSAIQKDTANWTSTKRWAGFLTKQASDHVRWFYLPPDPDFSFQDRMAVDFRSIIRLPKPDIEALRTARVGRLNKVAYEHFREKVAHFFRRYPYDPWYPLTSEELAEYSKGLSEPVRPFPWQE